MSRAILIFAAWCGLVVAGHSTAAYFGWSPFGDDGPRTVAAGFGGPTHK
ncbi:hypothetical protein [Zavarzinia sp. CC-PAN008]